MNRATRLSILLLVAGFGPAAALAAQEGPDPHGRGAVAPGRGDLHSKGWETAMRLRREPLPPRFPDIGRDARRVVFDNGLVIFVREDRRLPLVRFEALLRVGEIYETPEDYGVAGMLGTMMRTGGTDRFEPDALDDRLAFLAASLSVGIGEDSGSVSLDLLSKDAEEGLSIFAEVLRRPRFDEGRLALAKRRSMNAILQRNNSPGPVLSRELRRLFYPEDHPSGRDMTPRRLAAIDREEMKAFYARFFRPENVRVAAVGDFDQGEMVERLRGALGDWPRVGDPVALPSKFVARAKPGVFVVDMALNQSSIALAHPGIDRDDPDRHAVSLMNSILGGGSFSSRITERVRSDEGLAYSARSSFPTSSREPELFQATVQTKTETTGRAVEILVEEIGKMAAGPISANEFATARESALYGMVFRFDRPAEAVSRLMRLEFEGLPYDQDRRDFEGLSAVTPETVVAAAKRHLKPDALTIFVVGAAAAFAADVAQYGEARKIQPVEYDFASFREAGFSPGR